MTTSVLFYRVSTCIIAALQAAVECCKTPGPLARAEELQPFGPQPCHLGFDAYRPGCELSGFWVCFNASFDSDIPAPGDGRTPEVERGIPFPPCGPYQLAGFNP